MAASGILSGRPLPITKNTKMLDPHQEKVLILDFGSQYTQLVARRVRELKVYCEIHPYYDAVPEIGVRPPGLILSGGPRSVYDRDAPAWSRTCLAWGCRFWASATASS